MPIAVGNPLPADAPAFIAPGPWEDPGPDPAWHGMDR